MSNKKDTNPKDAVGIRKVAMSCLSVPVVAMVAQAYHVMGLDEDIKEIRTTSLYNAAMIELMVFWEGLNETAYPPPLARAMAYIMFLRSAELEGTLIDDRIPTTSWFQVKELNKQASKIIDKYPECKSPFTHANPNVAGAPMVLDRSKAIPFHNLPWQVVLEAALGMMEGARKYGRYNYRAVGVRASVYYDAGVRHLSDFIEGTDIDEDSGLPHLVKFLSCISVLLDSQLMGNWIDDRPIRLPDYKEKA